MVCILRECFSETKVLKTLSFSKNVKKRECRLGKCPKKRLSYFPNFKKESLFKIICQFYTLLFDKVDKKRGHVKIYVNSILNALHNNFIKCMYYKYKMPNIV